MFCFSAGFCSEGFPLRLGAKDKLCNFYCGTSNAFHINILQHVLKAIIIEPRCEKTGFLHMQKQKRRSAAQ